MARSNRDELRDKRRERREKQRLEALRNSSSLCKDIAWCKNHPSEMSAYCVRLRSSKKRCGLDKSQAKQLQQEQAKAKKRSAEQAKRDGARVRQEVAARIQSTARGETAEDRYNSSVSKLHTVRIVKLERKR